MLRYCPKEASKLEAVRSCVGIGRPSFGLVILRGNPGQHRTLVSSARPWQPRRMGVVMVGNVLQRNQFIDSSPQLCPAKTQHRSYGKYLDGRADVEAKVIIPVPPLAESLSEGTVKQLTKRIRTARCGLIR
jgi:hypothetical protein